MKKNTPDSPSMLCADCGREIAPSMELHPSLCAKCEDRIMQSATWQLKEVE